MERGFSFRIVGVLAALSLTLGGCSHNIAPDSAGRRITGMTLKQITSVTGQTRNYVVFVPEAYSNKRRWPVIVFLHGIGESGTDPRSVLQVGLAPFVAAHQETFPFICIFPQSTGDWSEDSPAAADAIAIIDQVSKSYSVDVDRISLTGLSTGGYGTWAIGAKYREKFAALVPMASSKSDLKDAARLVDMPIHSFHNADDPFAASSNDHDMVAKIRELGGKAEYTGYSAGGHDCWETAYSDGALFAWLQEQRRHGAASPTAMAK